MLTDKELMDKYPKLFRQKDDPMSTTCMCWGIECGPGWFPLIDKLCASLMYNLEEGEEPPEFTQIKEKFGGLRTYVDSATEKQYRLIDHAAWASYLICEHCGTTVDTTTQGGWVKTLCSKCREVK